jgi:phenylalanyl-tRNA synthetase alpha chain
MEGVRLWKLQELGVTSRAAGVDFMLQDLKNILERLSRHLFGKDIDIKWVDAYFPFTDPSLELEVFYQQKWLEILGCGVLHPGVIKNAGLSDDYVGWAFGLGLERWAMRLFDIPDIRLFWSTDPRFTGQFAKAQGITKYKSISRHPVCYKDISFWEPSGF